MMNLIGLIESPQSSFKVAKDKTLNLANYICSY